MTISVIAGFCVLLVFGLPIVILSWLDRET